MINMRYRVAFVGDYVPRRCGIATFTHDVQTAVTSQYPGADCYVCAVTDIDESYDYPESVLFEIVEHDIQTYEQAAEFINLGHTDVVCVQHEYGIYGGPSGSHILALMRAVQAPIVTTLHTILEAPTADQRRVMEQVVAESATVVVMTERGRRMLQDIYHVRPEKIAVIPHGIPDMPFVDPNSYKDQFGVEGKKVILTFGLLSPGKGIEHMISAMPEIAAEIPEAVYIVLGATHPNLVRNEGESYLMNLERLAERLGVKDKVIFYNRFVETNELTEFIGATDVYVTPYLNEAQITSGTLAYAFGSGKAVVSTPYWHAEELLADERGVLVPFRDSKALAREIISLLTDDIKRQTMQKRAHMLGREMTWSQVAHRYYAVFKGARGSHPAAARMRAVVRPLAESGRKLPIPKIDHLKRLTDETGILQHATYGIPNYHEGYCTDDTARALVLALRLDEEDQSDEVHALLTRYAAFLNYSFIPETGRFRNFMSYDRRWLDDAGSDDSNGRALWALGAATGRAREPDVVAWAADRFGLSVQSILDTTSPRAWAFALSGIYEYQRRLPENRAVRQVAETLTGRLLSLYRDHGSAEWRWFEPVVSYANARLSHALILSGRMLSNNEATDVGLATLAWLCEIQTSETGLFRPIGSNGFYPQGGERALFDQQPVEAYSTVVATLAACVTTQDARWLEEARTAFDWFLGTNDLGVPLYSPRSGGCHDGLHVDRVNQNMGAESTLAYLLSLVEMQTVLNSIAAYDAAIEPEPQSLPVPERADFSTSVAAREPAPAGGEERRGVTGRERVDQ